MREKYKFSKTKRDDSYEFIEKKTWLCKWTLWKQKQDKQHGFIGFSLYTARYVPLTDSKEDAYAAQRATTFLINW